MFCFLSHLIEDCYFDGIEMFFFVVGHTHNILDQWFGVLARAIRSANFIGSYMALHAIYKIAHDKKVEHLRPKEVHQLEHYHDWRNLYARVINEDIHHFNVPLRWKLTRDPVLSVAVAQYMVVSPTSGLSYLEKWQPVASQLGSTDDNGTVSLSLFDTYSGPEALFNAIGINTTKHSSSVELLTAVASNNSMSENVESVASVLPIIRKIEVRAIAETEVRMQQEADNGFAQDKVNLPKQYLQSIDREITRTNSSRGGRIVWLRRSKISDDPNYLSRRPDILPNPELWRGLSATHARKQRIADEEAVASGKQKSIIKVDPEVTLANSRLVAFQKSAAEMATTASLIIKLVPSQIDVDNAASDIKTATLSFRKPVLTRREYDWYESISTANRILQRQQALVTAEMRKPWELLNIPVETPEQQRWREGITAQRALIAAQTEYRLRRLVHRLGEGEYNPDLQVVTMDGFVPAQTTDINLMKKPQLLLMAKGHIPNFRKLKVDELREQLKTFMAANPGVVLLPGEEADPIAVVARSAAPDSTNIPVAITEFMEPSDEPPANSTEENLESATCAVMECNDPATVWCEHCHLSFCTDLHAEHTSHSMQTLKDGISSKSDWEQDISRVRMRASENSSPEDTAPTIPNKKRKNASSNIVHPTTSMIPNTTDPKSLHPLSPAVQHDIITDASGLTDKRALYELEKLSKAADFIQALQSCNNMNYDVLYSHFNYDNYYDNKFLCSLAASLQIDISDMTCKRRFSRKELLDYMIKKLI